MSILGSSAVCIFDFLFSFATASLYLAVAGHTTRLVMGRPYLVVTGLMTDFTQAGRNMFLPRSFWITTVSPFMLLNLNGPFHILLALRYNNTSVPVDSLVRCSEDFFALGPLLCLVPKATLLLFFLMLSITFSISIELSTCDKVGIALGSLGPAPNTGKIEQRPSGPIVKFIAKTASCRHFLLLVLRSVSILARSLASHNGAW